MRLRHREILAGIVTSQPIIPKPSSWSSEQSENDIYQPVVLPTDIVYIEIDSEVDEFLHRLEVDFRCFFQAIKPLLLFSVFEM